MDPALLYWYDTVQTRLCLDYMTPFTCHFDSFKQFQSYTVYPTNTFQIYFKVSPYNTTTIRQLFIPVNISTDAPKSENSLRICPTVQLLAATFAEYENQYVFRNAEAVISASHWLIPNNKYFTTL